MLDSNMNPDEDAEIDFDEGVVSVSDGSEYRLYVTTEEGQLRDRRGVLWEASDSIREVACLPNVGDDQEHGAAYASLKEGTYKVTLIDEPN